MKIVNGLNLQRLKCDKKKMLEMFWKTIDWKAIWKFYVTVTCDLHFDRTSRIICQIHDEKCDQWCLSILSNTYN